MMQASIRPADINPAILSSLYRKQFGLCNVKLDGEVIIERGKIVDPKMKVERVVVL
jgi:hypothetical protein